MNDYLAAFVDVLRQRFADDNVKMSMSEWIERNTPHPKAKVTNWKPFSFDGYEFQREIASDLHPDLVCIKTSQSGLTEIMVRKFLGILKRVSGLTGIFTLPTDEMFERVSKARIGPLVNTTPIFNEQGHGSVKPIRSMALYQVDNSFGYITGNKESDATSIPADFLFHDELDLSDQKMIALFQSRLNNSTFKVRQKFSTPTYPGFGIDAEYPLTDMHEYLVRCQGAGCNHWQVPELNPTFVCFEGAPDVGDFTELSDEQILGINYENSYVFCEKCGQKLDLLDPTLREWVPMRPGSPKRGYRVSTFSTNVAGSRDQKASRSLEDMMLQLIEYRRLEHVRGWYNTTLGRAYADAKSRLQEAQIRAVMSTTPFQPNHDCPCFIGIDVGQICHVVVGTPMVVFHWQRVHVNDLLQTVLSLTKQYNIVGGALDRHPYTPTAEAIRDATSGIILPVEYRGTVPVALIHDKTEFLTHAQGARTAMLDAVAEGVRRKNRIFANCMDEAHLIIAHLQDQVREEEEPGKPAVWKKLTGNDHYAHALAFYEFAQRLQYVRQFNSGADTRTMFGIGNVRAHDLETNPFGLKSRGIGQRINSWLG